MCHKSSDVAVITDASTSVGYRNYVKVRQFVESVAEEFHVGSSNRSHFAMIHFSWKAHLDFGFKDSRDWNLTKVDEAIMHSPYTYGTCSFCCYELVLTRRFYQFYQLKKLFDKSFNCFEYYFQLLEIIAIIASINVNEFEVITGSLNFLCKEIREKHQGILFVTFCVFIFIVLKSLELSWPIQTYTV